MSRGVGKVPPLQLVDFMQKQQNGLGGGLRWTPAANPRAKARHRGSVGNSLQGVHFGVGHVPGGKWHLNSVLEASTHPRPPPRSRPHIAHCWHSLSVHRMDQLNPYSIAEGIRIKEVI